MGGDPAGRPGLSAPVGAGPLAAPRHDGAMSEQKQDDQQSEGQVSEVSGMDPADAETPIAPDQAVAGYPDSESGQPDEGPAGPDGIPDHEHENKPHA